MKVTTGQAKRARTLAERNKSLNCSNAFYHLGLILTVLGVLFTILAMCTSYLFSFDISDLSKTPTFQRIHVPVGLYSAYAYNVTTSETEEEEWKVLEEPYDLSNSYIIAAGILTIIGLVAAIIVVIIHTLFCVKENFRKRKVIFVEIIFLLIAIVGVLAGLSLGETTIEQVHDGSSEELIKILVNNMKIPREKVVYQKDIPNNDNEKKDHHYVLKVSEPQYTFYFMITATFLFLFAFIFSLVYFVRLCERINKEERELRENLNKPDQPTGEEIMSERL